MITDELLKVIERQSRTPGYWALRPDKAARCRTALLDQAGNNQPRSRTERMLQAASAIPVPLTAVRS